MFFVVELTSPRRLFVSCTESVRSVVGYSVLPFPHQIPPEFPDIVQQSGRKDTSCNLVPRKKNDDGTIKWHERLEKQEFCSNIDGTFAGWNWLIFDQKAMGTSIPAGTNCDGHNSHRIIFITYTYVYVFRSTFFSYEFILSKQKKYPQILVLHILLNICRK